MNMEPPENNELYPELIDYIYRFAEEFKTAEEKLAGKTILYNSKGLDPKMLNFIKLKGWFSDDENIRKMIADGFDTFKRKVAYRIFKEHRNELHLNLCPRCKKIARTPQAKQCRFCYFDWH